MASSLHVYPNPVNDNLYLEVDDDIKEVSVYNITGMMVYNEQFTNYNERLTIDLSNFDNGIYFVKIKSDSGEILKKIVKQ